MSPYPTEIINQPSNIQPPKYVKQTIIAVFCFVISTICLFYLYLLSQTLFAIFANNGSFSTTIFSLSVLLVTSLLITSSAINSLLVKHPLVRLVNIVLSSLVFLLYQTNLVLPGILMVVYIICFAGFTISVHRSLNIYKKISLSHLILPHINPIFVSISLILTLPTFFFLQQNPQTIHDFVQTKILTPIIDQIVYATSGQIAELKTNSDLNSIIPQQFSQHLPPELLSELSLNQIKNSYPDPSSTFKQEMLNQTDQIISPYIPYAPYLIPILIFITILQTGIFIKPFFFIFPWIAFKTIFLFKIATIAIHEESVEQLQL